MTEEESRILLERSTLGRLAASFDDQPYVVPYFFRYNSGENCIETHGRPGKLIHTLRANPKACLQVDEIQDDYHWRSVLAFGRYEEITVAAERERILGDLFRRLPHLTPVESFITKGISESIVFRLRINAISGVCEQW